LADEHFDFGILACRARHASGRSCGHDGSLGAFQPNPALRPACSFKFRDGPVAALDEVLDSLSRAARCPYRARPRSAHHLQARQSFSFCWRMAICRYVSSSGILPHLGMKAAQMPSISASWRAHASSYSARAVSYRSRDRYSRASSSANWKCRSIGSGSAASSSRSFAIAGLSICQQHLIAAEECMREAATSRPCVSRICFLE
jgi:hypothetical protein